MSTPTQSEPQDDLSAVFEKIQEIVAKSADGDYLYRGEPKHYKEHPYEGKVSSNLWREYYKVDMGIYTIEEIQELELKDAKRYINGDGFEALTQLQHYGGKTNLIDFTTDYLIALFFACDGSYDKCGRVILLPKTEEIKEKYRVEEPRNPQNRVIAQKSIFIRPPDGFIEPKPDDVINIPKSLKLPTLEYLRKYHNISIETIYNDIHGFIKSQDIRWCAHAEFGAALACEKEQDYENTIRHYTECLKINPQQTYAYHNRGLAYYRYIGDYDRAIMDFNEAIKREPDYAEAYNDRGAAYGKKGDYDHAIGDFNKVIDLTPDNAETYYNRGRAYCLKGDHDSAIEDYNKAIDLNPDYANAYCGRGEAYRNKGEIDRAIVDFNTAIRFQSDLVNAYYNGGLAYYAKGNIDRAIENFNMTIRLEPDFAPAYYNRGAIYGQQGNYNRAIIDFNKVIDLKPNDADAYYGRGGAYRHKGDYDNALADYNVAIQLNPNVDAYINRGATYGIKGKYELAIKDFNTAIELKPNDAKAYDNRGIAYRKKGDFDRAIVDFNKAIECKPDFAESYYNRGLAWLLLKEWEKTKSDLTTAKEKGANIVDEFRMDYESVSDFEGKHDIQLPPDIAAILTPQ